MNLTNYHSHCSFCDGRAPLEDFIKEAIAQGFTSYGVSSHAPLPFPTHWTMEWEQVPFYLEECKTMKARYSEQIELYIGMEIDYLNEESNPSASCFRELPLDYRIGSVHILYNDRGEVLDIDCGQEKFKEIVDTHFDSNIREVVSQYYAKLMHMVDLGGFDIVGHADKIHYNASCYHAGLLDESWYNDIMEDYFSAIARKGYMVEINTKAFEQYGTFYPNQRYFSLLKRLNIPVLVNSDAHYPDRINSGRKQALMALVDAGFKTVMELHNSQWEERQILSFENQ